MPSSPSSSLFPSLPLELLLEITALLDYGSILRLSLTCRSFQQRLDPATVCPARSRIAFYQHAERHFAQHAARLVCYRCFRFLDPAQFSDLQRRGRRGKFSSHPGEQAKRFCWDCGVRRGLYTHGGRVRKGGMRYEICARCDEATVESRACRFAQSKPAAGEGADAGAEAALVVLRDCSRRDDMRPRRTSALERLPAHVLERVMRMLGYEDLRALKRASRYLREVVDPVKHSADVHGAWRFVRERLRKGAGERIRGDPPLACFGCFRVRSKRHFSRQQHDVSSPSGRREGWRRRCWECLRRFYHPVLADVEARERFNRQVLCARCKCLRYVDEDCVGCVGVNDFWDGAESLADWFEAAAVSANSEALPAQDDDVWDEGIGLWLDNVGFGEGDSSRREDNASKPEPASTGGGGSEGGGSSASSAPSSRQHLGHFSINDVSHISVKRDNGEGPSSVPLWQEGHTENRSAVA
ncbi:hypothetical protein MFIFM68171_06320 [Madurella fahalii]|uniref:F-box domain-containing protein n=1 Tax=Madurella fahalii TaxID=1157608 RepID=A0ABQ0GEY2_9PEZI